LHWPLPEQGFGNRLLVRALALLARRQVACLSGIEHILPERDPFILAMNHTTRSEAVLVPTLLFLRRGGRLIHLIGDWNFRLIPGLGLIYRRAEAVTVTRKSARPRILNFFKPFYEHPVPALEQARAYLSRGRSIGIFPEGTVNREPDRLLRGRLGAARLSLETRVPIVPAGIRFPALRSGERIGDRAAMEVHIGAPLNPPPCRCAVAQAREVRAWHAAMMRELARLSGKAWHPPAHAEDSQDNPEISHAPG
jgi:1-acyl-sn-glycerol-3-phosphate acyltransferase